MGVVYRVEDGGMVRCRGKEEWEGEEEKGGRERRGRERRGVRGR